MSDSPNPPEHLIFYKKGKKIATRRPKDDAIAFRVTVKNVKTRTLTQNIKTFLKYVVTEVKDLNLLKNDVCFLMNDLYGKDHSVDTSVPLEKGYIFYVWCYLPYRYETEAPQELAGSIVAHDLVYIRQNLTSTQVKTIKEILKKDVDVEIHSRRLHEKVELPYKIAVVDI